MDFHVTAREVVGVAEGVEGREQVVGDGVGSGVGEQTLLDGAVNAGDALLGQRRGDDAVLAGQAGVEVPHGRPVEGGLPVADDEGVDRVAYGIGHRLVVESLETTDGDSTGHRRPPAVWVEAGFHRSDDVAEARADLVADEHRVEQFLARGVEMFGGGQRRRDCVDAGVGRALMPLVEFEGRAGGGVEQRGLRDVAAVVGREDGRTVFGSCVTSEGRHAGGGAFDVVGVAPAQTDTDGVEKDEREAVAHRVGNVRDGRGGGVLRSSRCDIVGWS